MDDNLGPAIGLGLASLTSGISAWYWHKNRSTTRLLRSLPVNTPEEMVLSPRYGIVVGKIGSTDPPVASPYIPSDRNYATLIEGQMQLMTVVNECRKETIDPFTGEKKTRINHKPETIRQPLDTTRYYGDGLFIGSMSHGRLSLPRGTYNNLFSHCTFHTGKLKHDLHSTDNREAVSATVVNNNVGGNGPTLHGYEISHTGIRFGTPVTAIGNFRITEPLVLSINHDEKKPYHVTLQSIDGIIQEYANDASFAGWTAILAGGIASAFGGYLIYSNRR